MAKDIVGSYERLTDTGTTEQRQRYIKLLEILSDIYYLEGLPKDRSTLFNDYKLPPNIPSLETLISREISFPTSRGHEGYANILFNSDFTLILGRVSSTKSDYGYMVMLLRNDKDHLYTTVEHTVERKTYRYSHGKFLIDLQELVIMAFRRAEDRKYLSK